MSIIDTLIYDRTIDDVNRVKELTQKALANGWSSLSAAEQTEYLSNPKGAYNYADLNRVGAAVAYVATQLTTLPATIAAYLAANGIASDAAFEVPYTPSEIIVTAKQDWTVADVPTQADAAAYIADITLLYGAFDLENAPTPPVSLDYLTYETANDIERILALVSAKAVAFEREVKEKIDRAKLSIAYSGEIYCGEAIA